MKDKALGKIDELGDDLKDAKGFEGMLAFSSLDDPNSVTMLTLWESEESMRDSENTAFKRARDAVADMISETPRWGYFEAREMVAQKISMPT